MNAFLEKQAFARQQYLDLGVQWGFQRMADAVTMALNDPDTMGKQVLGGEMIDKILRRAVEYDTYYSAAHGNEAETDYARAKLDERLTKISKGRIPPFEVRYPFCKEQHYIKKGVSHK